MCYPKLEVRKLSGGVQARSKGEGVWKKGTKIVTYLVYQQTLIHVFQGLLYVV